MKLHPGCCAHFPNFIGNLSEILPPGCPSNTSYFMAKTELSSPALQTVSLRHWSTPTPVYRAAAHPWLLCVTPPHSRAPLQVAARIPCILLGFVKLLRRGERLPLPWKGGEQNRTIVYHNKCFNLFEGKCMRLSMPFIYLYALLICRIYIFMF